jgi:hypothetical protein
MALLDTPIDKISERDLQRLIEAGATESLYIDYKRQTYGPKESDHAEFLADISSFANTSGGDLVIGMAETGGVPTEFVPFIGDADTERRRLEEIARTGLEPRIRNLQIRMIPVSDRGRVIIVRAPRSYLPPHRVTYKNRNRFWARASSGKYEPNIEELRHLFNDSPQLAERIRSFRNDRIIRITAGELPVPVASGGKVALHVVPLPSFADNRLLDVVSSIASGTHVPLPLGGMSGANRVDVNLDGFLNYTELPTAARASYAQFFRTGAIEGVGELSRRKDDGNAYFVGPEFTEKIVFSVWQYLSVLKAFDAGLPIFAFLSLCDIKGCYYRHTIDGMGWNDAGPLQRDVVALPEVYIENFDVDVPAIMRPVFNTLWNAFGFAHCDMYNDRGNWKGRPPGG